MSDINLFRKDRPVEEIPQKNQASVELGRPGGEKGGKARAKKLTPEQHKEIVKKAAQTRWFGDVAKDDNKD